MANANNLKPVISIVPRLPSAIDGVGDYALNLARQLKKDFDINTHFVVGDPTWTGNDRLEGFKITKVLARSPESLFNQLAEIYSETPILLHYVGYGYAKRGYPNWLVEGLTNWKHRHHQAKLVTMFHEIYASGPIWTSAFWLSELQKRLVRQLLRLSDRVLTSKQLHAEVLQHIIDQQAAFEGDKRLPIPILPVFSNVGECKNVLPLNKRDRILVVFGKLDTRLRVYQNCQNELLYTCERFGIRRIVDIGPANGLKSFSTNSIPVEVLGSKSAFEVSKILSSAFAGFIDYPTDFLGKSGIFASYCAHGSLPIVRGPHRLDADGLIVGHHYWHLDFTNLGINVLAAQQIATNAHTWYQAHSLAAHAGQFSVFLS
ncbi:hypothetical protein C8255_11455 [filamentous cyanobacterium CCP3]|nr:hypothetical protein C8255_11455 [filamentous cyanobacterium CCP3]